MAHQVEESLRQMEEWVKQLNDAAKRYYTPGDSPMSDAQWDALYDRLRPGRTGRRSLIPPPSGWGGA